MKNTDGRQSNGGARLNSGRRKTTKTLYSQKEMRQMLHEIVQENSCQGFKEVVRSLVVEAKRNPKAAAYVIDQLIGKASGYVSLDISNTSYSDPNQVAKQYIAEIRGERSL